MGIFLNPGSELFEEAIHSEIYIDKTGMIRLLNKVINTLQKYVCISRPRRFGKTTDAYMVSSYYDRTVGRSLFSGFEINQEGGLAQQGKYDVLRLNMQSFLSRSTSAEDMLNRLQKRVGRELTQAYSHVNYYDTAWLSDIMDDIYAAEKVKFVIVIDEWDCIFREYKEDQRAQKMYLDFLRDWLKDKEYVALTYMTGILPIKKYGSHSALNMFTEYSMENPGAFAKYTGFTETEVQNLCRKYEMDFEECSYWYNGYRFPKCDHIYNPKSIIMSMREHHCADYWNQTETFEALKLYLDMNFDGLRDDVIKMLAGDRVRIETRSFQNDMTSFSRRDDIFTLLIHLGYLGYDSATGEVFIPNHEIQLEFITATETGGWTEIINSVKESEKLLQATWRGQTDQVSSAIEKAHLETSHLQYNDENALSYTLSLAYYAARQYYTIVRELPSGKGFADLAFIPRKKFTDKPAMIIELKWDKDAPAAIRQIKEKGYTDALRDYHGNLLLVGINYNKTTRKHDCVIETYTPSSAATELITEHG